VSEQPNMDDFMCAGMSSGPAKVYMCKLLNLALYTSGTVSTIKK